ncbi:MAG: ribose 5-phosphate isomerase B [Holosporales bacterium]|jgi:2-polyprenyl-6-hydroxyphenyl methylase/3-demethylubiquinone-9 3-methyltransferase|nr:ribose 5-phosphate isomerase B [Holosporales bacterium]
MNFLSIAIASDHRGYWLKKDLIDYFQTRGHNTFDYGTENDCVSVDYPDYAKKVVEHILTHDNTFGILVCYSGLGMTMVANRFDGIRAAYCNELELAKLAREHNDANVICFGSAFVTPELAIRCTEIFATTQLANERHKLRINKIVSAR